MMNTQNPLVSIIIPYYNCAKYIEETLQSVKSQTYSNYEIILVNDGSDEANTTFIEKLLESQPDIQYIYQENKGVSFARNNGGFQAQGEYILFLDADDLLHKTHLQKTVDILQSNPNCKLVYAKAELFEAQTGEWKLPPYQGLKSLLNSNMIYITALHRYSDFITLNGFDKNLSTHEDWDYWIRLLKDGGDAIRIDEVLFSYRKRFDKNSLMDSLSNNPKNIQFDWQQIYIKHNHLYLLYDLGYLDIITQTNQFNSQIEFLQNKNEKLSSHLKIEREKLISKIQQLKSQIGTLQSTNTQIKEQNDFLNIEIESLRSQLPQIDTLKSENEHIHHEIALLRHSHQQVDYRFHKYKSLVIIRLLKPLIKIEQNLHSLNRYRKAFRILMREKGSLGKAYQAVRRKAKSEGFYATKQFLKHLPTSTKNASMVTPLDHHITYQNSKEYMPIILKQQVTKLANQTLDLKVAIIAELSIPQCKKYRVTQKQEMLTNAGIPCSITSWTDFNQAMHQISLASVVIFYRVPGFDSVMTLINECHRLGIKTYWDVDDLIFDRKVLESSNTIKSLNENDRDGIINGAELYKNAMLACQEGIASTSGLAQAMKETGLTKVHTLENALDVETLETANKINQNPKTSNSTIRIIYGSGTTTHNTDFLEVAPSVFKILKENKNVAFRLIGYLELPTYFNEVNNQIERINFCNYTEYLTYLSECDISIAPLENFIFNDAKSNIKYLEASIVKVVSICSPRSAFSDVIIHNKNGFLANNQEEWYKYFKLLIDNKELRSNVATEAYNTIKNLYNPNHIGEKLISVIDFKKENEKIKILSFNVYYNPISFGGATIVAEQLNKRFADDVAYEVYMVTTLPVTDYLPAYHTIRYEYQNVTVFGISTPDLSLYENPQADVIIKDIIEIIKPDIAHIHCIQGLGVGLVDICKTKNIKTVVTLHDAWWICENQFMMNENGRFTEEYVDTKNERNKILSQALSNIDLLLSPSQYFADIHQRKLNRLIYVNKNGVLPPLSNKLKCKTNEIKFGYVGGNTNIKGVHLILESFRNLNIPNIKLVIVDNMINVGQQSFFDTDLNGIKNYSIIPAYTQDTIDDFFATIDVLLFPTQWKESFGLTVREAILRNVWVIATDAGGVVEDIIDGENGTIIPFESGTKELTEAILDVYKHYQSMANGEIIDLQKSHIRTFDEQKDELLQFYQDLLK